jgi:hypothetical protein
MDIIDTLVEVRLKQPDDFLKVRETLSRIGVASQKQRILYQSCHILHKKGKFYIIHFKELFKLDGKPSNFTDDDLARRNTIANILAQWGLVDLVDPAKSASPIVPINHVKILSYKEKGDWTLEVKYNIGKKK